MEFEALAPHMTKILLLHANVYRILHEAIFMEFKYDPKQTYYTNEELIEYDGYLRKVRTNMKHARIMLDSYLEALEIYKECTGESHDARIIDMNFMEIFPYLPDDIQEYFRNQLENNNPEVLG